MNASEAGKLDQGRITLYKASFLIFLCVTDHSSRMPVSTDFLFDLLRPSLYTFLNKELKKAIASILYE